MMNDEQKDSSFITLHWVARRNYEQTERRYLKYRFNNNQLEVLLVHSGGPFWAKKKLGAWFIFLSRMAWALIILRFRGFFNPAGFYLAIGVGTSLKLN